MYQFKSDTVINNIDDIEVEDIEGEDLIEGKNSCLIKVTLNYNDGVIEDGVLYVRYGKEYTELPEPTRTGYTFKGWNRLDGYQELEYIVANGNQYIDTNYNFKENETFEGKIYTTVQNTEMAVVALNDSYGILEVGFSKYNNVFFNWSSNDNSVSINPTESIYNNTFIFSTSVNSSEPYRKIYLNLDDSVYNKTGGTSSGVNGNHKIRLFAISNGYLFNGRIYYIKIYDNNELVRDYIPCYRISDNKKGLYDLINNVFYPNASSSSIDFSAGSNVYVSDSTIVSTTENHTLTAVWEENG